MCYFSWRHNFCLEAVCSVIIDVEIDELFSVDLNEEDKYDNKF